ncbi:MAG: DNA glycosylase [Verrucomicrobiota bacterium]
MPRQPLPLDPAPANATVLAELLDGGQAFRWRQAGCKPGVWMGRWSTHAITIQADQSSGGRLVWTGEADAAAVHRYFAADRDWATLIDDLPWRSDPHLARCLAAYPGLRILRQPFGETLLGFLCSATKQIVQIKQMMALLAECLGEGGALPTWERLATADDAVLRGCQLGFRAGYIKRTAEFLAERPGWLELTEALPYAEAKARLCALPGVGEKVADCVLLFGAGKLEAFPVDTWIIKVMSRHYGLDGWSPAQVAHFGRAHFGASAGLAQQFLFAWERANRV